MINFEYTLGFMDYTAFVVIVAIYFILTIYFNTRINSNVNKNQSGSNSEWNVKKNDENFFSVALSNIIKYSSWMILLGICNDAYENGIQFLIFFFVGSTFMTIFMNFVLIPVFHESEVSTLSEYFEQRFDDTKIRIFASMTSIIYHIFLISLSIYTLTLMLSVVMNVNFFILASILLTTYIIIFIICNKRIKTHTWTNIISILMTCGFIGLILIKGVINFGGFSTIWKINWLNGNIKMPDFNFNPRIRETIWSLMTGGFFWFTAMNTNKKSIKKWIELKEKGELKKSMIIYLIGTSIITILCTFFGMLTYAAFQNSNIIMNNELLTQLLMKNFNQAPAVTGIFISIIFISTFNYVSCELRMIRGIVNENVRKIFLIDTKTMDVTIMRLTAIIVSILSILLIPLLENSTSSLLELTISIPFTFIGSTLGILIIGIMIPWIGRRATFYGSVIALFMMIYYVMMSEIDFLERKLVSNSTEIHMKLIEKDKLQFNYISTYYFLPSSVLLTCINAFILSFIFGFENSIHINSKNFAPFMRNFISHHQIIENASSDSNLMLNDEEH
ncbi:sodium-coupled monocarboxylate transporter 2-like [Chironomus tepperi]|uniref:sodium-coupled monocarboxylate transporter 2-like n=1 Tax=Chironomus tepperi TaxID=113505 RepID=UPI00391F77D3